MFRVLEQLGDYPYGSSCESHIVFHPAFPERDIAEKSKLCISVEHLKLPCGPSVMYYIDTVELSMYISVCANQSPGSRFNSGHRSPPIYFYEVRSQLVI